MRYAGIALIFIGAYLLARRNRAREREGLSLLLGYESFVREMRSRAANTLEPVSRWAGGFECPALERAGFLPSVREGKRLAEAFREASAGLDRAAKDALTALFSRTGASLDDEIRRIDTALAVVGKRAEDEAGASEERARLFSVLALAISAGVGILAL